MISPTPSSLLGARSNTLLTSYQIFSELAGCKSMSEAAWNLDLDVSVVSRHIAAVEHTFGSGKTLLIGTFPGGSYYRTHTAGTREFFAGLLPWAGIRQQVQSSDAAVKARLHKGSGGTYVWVINPTRTAKDVKISLPSSFQRAADLWPESGRPVLSGNALAVTVGDRNAAVVKLE